MGNKGANPMLDVFIFETNQLLEQSEEILLRAEENNNISKEDINEIFRVMHTIKGSAAMMEFSNISIISHGVEDLFDYIRQEEETDFTTIIDVVFLAQDFIKAEMEKIRLGKKADGDEKTILGKIKKALHNLKENAQKNEQKGNAAQGSKYVGFHAVEGSEDFKKYKAKIFYEDGCGMENIRAFSFLLGLKDFCGELYYRPLDIEDNKSADYIIKNGLELYFSSNEKFERIENLILQVLFLKSYELDVVESYEDDILDIIAYLDDDSLTEDKPSDDITNGKSYSKIFEKRFINVDTTKLDNLLDLVGEIVIAESMVTKNPQFSSLNSTSFEKVARQLERLIDQLQDSVMSIRMIPMSNIFSKMHRIVRDMSKKLDKEVGLTVIGEETEVDKNVINLLADPLMHLIRNALDHGIESAQERVNMGKPAKGNITISAINSGSDVVVVVSDDGKGLDKDKILKKAKSKGLVNKNDEELTDKDIFNFILSPGFSTKEKVTEFSGRGVGMDVVRANVIKIGGDLSVDSVRGKGTTITISIPLTLAVIAGMKVCVGNNIYTIPTSSVSEFLKADKNSIITDTSGNEIIMIREECYPVLRLHELFNVKTDVTDLYEGVMVMVEFDGKKICLFADNLDGEQNVVVKPVPAYLAGFAGEKGSIGGCTILGDGSISLILDVKNIINDVI